MVDGGYRVFNVGRICDIGGILRAGEHPIDGLVPLRIPQGDMPVDVRNHQLAGIVGTDDLHGQIVIPDFREQGRHLQELQGVVAEGDGNIGPHDAGVKTDRIHRALLENLLVIGQISGRFLLLLQVIVQDGNVFQVRSQLLPHQFQSRPHGLFVPLAVQDALHRERDHDTQGDGQHPAEKGKESFFERSHHKVKSLDKDNVFRGKRLHFPLEIQPGAAKREIQPHIQVQVHPVTRKDRP